MRASSCESFVAWPHVRGSLNEIQLAPLFAQREAAVLDVFDQLVDRCVPGVDVRALIDARQKTGLPVL